MLTLFQGTTAAGQPQAEETYLYVSDQRLCGGDASLLVALLRC